MIQGTHNALDDARNETVKIFINGELIVRKDAKISLFDSGYLVEEVFGKHKDYIRAYWFSLIYILNYFKKPKISIKSLVFLSENSF